MKSTRISKEDVITSNERFYDQISSVYDTVDSRRSDGLDHNWLRSIIQSIHNRLNISFADQELTFLDAGAGSGFLSYMCNDYFSQNYLVDLSQKMLDRIEIKNSIKIKADCDSIPLDDETIHFIGAFATLHHLYQPLDFFKESFRLLKKDGIIYTDHDIEQSFVKNFNLPLKIYRYFFDHGPKYIEASPESTIEDYEISEFHGDTGLCGSELEKELYKIGFREVRATYHWCGGGVPEKILSLMGLKKILSRRGFAPNLRIIAKK